MIKNLKIFSSEAQIFKNPKLKKNKLNGKAVDPGELYSTAKLSRRNSWPASSVVFPFNEYFSCFMHIILH